MEHQPVSVALVGCGAVTERYYSPALCQLIRENMARVCALVDIDPQRTANIAPYFPGAVELECAQELQEHGVELAILASPPRHHAEQAVQLLKSGYSVLCEKPLATTVADAETVLEAAAAAPGVLALGMSRRFFPAIQAIDRILSAGWLGELRSFAFAEGTIFRWPVKSAAYFNKLEAQGVFMDIGSHVLDLALRWFGEPDQLSYEDDALGGIEANCLLQLGYPSGLTGEIRLSRDCQLANYYLITGSNAWLGWPVNDTHRFEMGMQGSKHGFDAKLSDVESFNGAPRLQAFDQDFGGIFAEQIRNVIQAMRSGKTLVAPGRDGLESLRMIERSYRQRTLMRMPWLSEQEQTQAVRLSLLE